MAGQATGAVALAGWQPMSEGHYFDAHPRVASAPSTVRLDLPDASFVLTTDRGVFAAGGVDPGTRLLLVTVPPAPPTGDLLDLGCGYGPVALTMAHRSPGAVVWAVDVNERARALCSENAARAGLANVRVVAPEAVPDTVRFGAMWSNPPIRIGKDALHALLEQWLGRLQPGALGHLVVQRHLGSDSLAKWLASVGFDVHRMASRQGYRVLAVGG
jgi:16S rRNA (guanine1207-N2)-methyltransferase